MCCILSILSQCPLMGPSDQLLSVESCQSPLAATPTISATCSTACDVECMTNIIMSTPTNRNRMPSFVQQHTPYRPARAAQFLSTPCIATCSCCCTSCCSTPPIAGHFFGTACLDDDRNGNGSPSTTSSSKHSKPVHSSVPVVARSLVVTHHAPKSSWFRRRSSPSSTSTWSTSQPSSRHHSHSSILLPSIEELGEEDAKSRGSSSSRNAQSSHSIVSLDSAFNSTTGSLFKKHFSINKSSQSKYHNLGNKTMQIPKSSSEGSIRQNKCQTQNSSFSPFTERFLNNQHCSLIHLPLEPFDSSTEGSPLLPPNQCDSWKSQSSSKWSSSSLRGSLSSLASTIRGEVKQFGWKLHRR